MKFKNRFILLAFSLILILSISAASANDNVTLDDAIAASETDEVSIDNNDELISSSTIYISPEGTGSGSSSKDPTNWNSAIAKANSGDTIQFLNGTYTNIKGNLYQNIELKGSGNSIIDAQGDGGFFTNYGSLTLRELSLVNAFTGKHVAGPDSADAGYDGEGGLVNEGTLNIYNCYFGNNTGWGTKGGTLHNTGTCYIYDSTFFGHGGKKGGAIYTEENSRLYIYNSLFNKGISKEGNAVNAKKAYVEIHNSSVVNSSAKNGMFSIKETTMYIYGSYFFNSRSVDTGTVFNIDKGSSVTIDNCIFEKLTSTGGAVWFTNGTKMGEGNGGAIVVEKQGTVTVKNSVFDRCVAKNYGGAIFVESSGKATIDNCTFKSNSALDGNNIYSVGITTVSNSQIEINSTIESEDIEYGQIENVKVNYDEGTNGVLNPTVKLLLDGKDIQKTITKSSAVELSDLGLGNHTLTLEASDSNSNRYVFTNPQSIFVVGGNVEVNVDYTIAEDGSINAIVSDEYGRVVSNRNVVITVDGKNYTAKTNSNGIATIKPSLDVGSYEISIAVDGKVVSNKSCSQKINISNSTVTSDVVDVKYSYGNDGSIKAIVTDENGKIISDTEVKLTINGQTYTNTTDSNGIATFYPTESAGEYDVNVEIEGKNISSTSPKTIKVMPNGESSTIIADDIKRGYGSSYDFKATFMDFNANVLKNKEVTFIINGNEYDVFTNEYGVALFKNNLTAGVYTITALNPATSQNITRQITIVDRISGSKNIKMDYSYSGTYKVRLYADNGNPVGANEKLVVTLNKKTYDVKTDSNGYAVLKIKNNALVPKTYTLTATYKGSKVSSKVVVKQILKSKNVKVKKSAKTKKFTATLKTTSGKAIKYKKITFKIKGKKYTAKTNKKGVATIKIKQNLKAGKYVVYVKYLKTTIKKTLTVKK